MMNEYEYYHIGYVVLHRNKIWLSLCSTSKHLFFDFGHQQCNTHLNRFNPSLQIFKSKSRNGCPLTDVIVLTHGLKILQRRIKKRLKINKSFKSLMNREITNKFLLKKNIK